MKTVGVYEAKTHLAQLLSQVEKGNEVTITRHGKPVAKIVPIDGGPRRSMDEVIASIREFRKGHTLDGITIRELIEDGRRF